MSKPYHILYLLHSLGGGGTENGVVNLLNRMDSTRFRFTLAVIKRDRALQSRIERDDVRVVPVGRRWGNDPLFPLKLMQLFREEQPDLVHTRGFSCIEGIGAARLAGIHAVLHSEHGRDVDEAHKMKRRRAALRSVLFRMADAVMTVSDELQVSLRENVRVPSDKLVTIPNGVDLARFRGATDVERSRERLGLPEKGKVIISVGRHDPVKDYESLLRAFRQLRKSHEDAVLLLVGNGPQTDDLVQLARELDVHEHVHFSGFVEDVPGALAASDVFVLPSVTEGMSNALLEAMAAGLPCVATDVGGNGELVDEGTTGFLVPPSDPERLCSTMRRLLTTPKLAERMGRGGRSRVENHFSLDTMVARYADLYAGLIERSRTDPGGRGSGVAQNWDRTAAKSPAKSPSKSSVRSAT